MKKTAVLILVFIIALPVVLSAQAQESLPPLSLDDAIKTAIESSYVIQLKQAAVQEAHGRLRMAKGGADVTVGADASYSVQNNPYGNDPYYGANGIDNVKRDTLATSVWIQKDFSFGLQSKLSVGAVRTLDTYEGSEAADMAQNQYGDKHTSRGTLNLELSLPLFKSFNSAILANNIQAAKDYYRQLEYELTDTISKTVEQVSAAYWVYFNAYQAVQQLETMIQTLHERIDTMPRLIAAGIRSRNDLLGMQVNLIENERYVVSARIDLNRARYNLQLAMGVETELGNPEHTFRELGSAEDEKLPSQDSIDFAFLEQVASTRSDILALQSQLAAAQANMRAAKAERRPDAVVSLSAGTTGAVYGDTAKDYLSSYIKNVPGANYTGALIFSMSLPNNGRSGAAEQAEANCRQAQIMVNQARQQLASQLKETVYRLNEYYNQVISANESLKMQKQLYENEKRRFAAGLITVDDIFNQDSKYLSAQTQYYRIMTDYLQCVMEYKYCTGTMVEYIGE